MCDFIEDYLRNPSAAISEALRRVREMNGSARFDDQLVYKQIASPEFRLYEEMIFCPSVDEHSSVSMRPQA